MDIENEQEQEGGSSGGSTTYITNYEVDLTEVEEKLDQQEETQQLILQELQKTNENIVYGAGVIGALIAMLLGFMCIKELLKVWLE